MIKPILFNTDMVRAILDGRKSCTRRVMKPQPTGEYARIFAEIAPYQPGDILYVRETFAQVAKHIFWYRADNAEYTKNILWKPSIHMSKEAARIFLKVTDVRIERLQDITEDGVKAEGAIDNRGFIHSPDNEYDRIHTAREHFTGIWNSTIKKSELDHYGWNANPWVFVIEFIRIDKPEEI